MAQPMCYEASKWQISHKALVCLSQLVYNSPTSKSFFSYRVWLNQSIVSDACTQGFAGTLPASSSLKKQCPCFKKWIQHINAKTCSSSTGHLRMESKASQYSQTSSILFCLSDSGSQGGLSLSPLSQGKRQGRLQTGCQSVAGLTYRDRPSFTHMASLKSPFNLTPCMSLGGSWNSRSKPTQTHSS